MFDEADNLVRVTKGSTFEKKTETLLRAATISAMADGMESGIAAEADDELYDFISKRFTDFLEKLAIEKEEHQIESNRERNLA
jgi:hypothetical protein